MRPAARAALLVSAALSCSEARAPTAPPEEEARLQIEIASGDSQAATAGRALEEFLVVQVSDQADTPVRGVPVLWAVLEGGGQLTVKRRTTDFDGLAAASLLLGEEPGKQRVRAELEDGSSVTFFAHARTQEPPPGPLGALRR